MKVAVVTGVNGFVGSHLVRELQKKDFEIIGVGKENKINAQVKNEVSKYYVANLIEEWPISEDIDTIIHLAGFSAVGPSYENPQLYINGNTAMVTDICEYYLKQNRKPRILIVSSGAIYDGNQPMPITEESCLGYTSPYVISKLAVENQAAYYRSRGLDIVVARPFNHIGPGQKKGFLLPDLASRIDNLSEYENKIIVGNLDTKRDYTDVRDIVKAYVILATKASLKNSVYNICSGVSNSCFEIFSLLLKAIDRTDIEIEVDESLVRPTDIMEITGDNFRIKNDTGWIPTYTLDQTIQDFAKGR